jgi:hypothetical protein
MYIFLSIIIFVIIVLTWINSYFWEKTYIAKINLDITKQYDNINDNINNISTLNTKYNITVPPQKDNLTKILNNKYIVSHKHNLESEHKSALISLVYQLESEDYLQPTEIVHSNRGGHHSQNNITQYPPFEELFKQLSPYLIEYSQKLNIDYQQLAIQAWFIINRSGNYNISHSHGDAVFSGCYYLSMDDTRNNKNTNGALYFMSPHYHKTKYKINNDVSFIIKPGTDIRDDGVIAKHNLKTNQYDITTFDQLNHNNIPHEAIRQHDILQKEPTSTSKLFLFPSRQYHQVRQYHSDIEDRIVIAFNIFYCDNQKLYFVPKLSDPEVKLIKHHKWITGYNIDENTTTHNLKLSKLKN